MKKQSKYITFKAKGLLLALLLFFAFGAKEWHIVMEHSRAALEICDTKPGDLHLHDSDHLQHSCSLCDFTFSFFELQLSSFHLDRQSDIFVKSEFAFISFVHSRTYIFQSLRAPPCLVFG